MAILRQVCVECHQTFGAPIHDARLSATDTGESQHPYIPGPMLDLDPICPACERGEHEACDGSAWGHSPTSSPSTGCTCSH